MHCIEKLSTFNKSNSFQFIQTEAAVKKYGFMIEGGEREREKKQKQQPTTMAKKIESTDVDMDGSLNAKIICWHIWKCVRDTLV